MNPIVKEDIDNFSLPAPLMDRLKDSVMIVTGATGLVGSSIVRCLDALNIGMRFILPVRNKAKAEELFGNCQSVTIVQQELTDFFNTLDTDCHYIIHCASPTNGKFICSHPVETFLLPIESSRALFEFALRKSIKGIVYLSSIEYYGTIHHNEPIKENCTGFVDFRSVRSAYPLGKQATEFLAYCYAEEKNLPVMTARLTQTFGAGIAPDDNRVFAQFARSVIENRDIELHTEGKSAKPYCYITDCVSALIYILLKGTPGEAYNVATPNTYVTIRELAELCRNNFNTGIKVTVRQLENSGYAPETTVNLNSDKLTALGWTPKYNLTQMMGRLIDYLGSAE